MAGFANYPRESVVISRELPSEPKFFQKIIAVRRLSVTLCAPFPFEGEG
jgi:hypothetical protein